MRGVILSGGLSQRLRPNTMVLNKHLLPIYNKPMIYYPIEFLRDSGVTNLLIILGGNLVGSIVELIGDGNHLGVETTYRYQHSASGIAHALKLARDFVQDEPFVTCLGDNIFEKPIADLWPRLYQPALLANDCPCGMIFISPTTRPSSFGVPTFDENNNLIKITEKPEIPDSNYAVTGLYCYDKYIWSMIDSLVPSARGELEITSVNNWYLENGKLNYHRLESRWTDAGTFESLYEANKLMMEKANGS